MISVSLSKKTHLIKEKYQSTNFNKSTNLKKNKSNKAVDILFSKAKKCRFWENSIQNLSTVMKMSASSRDVLIAHDW